VVTNLGEHTEIKCAHCCISYYYNSVFVKLKPNVDQGLGWMYVTCPIVPIPQLSDIGLQVDRFGQFEYETAPAS